MARSALEAAKTIAAQRADAEREELRRKNSDKFGICGKLQGKPVNIYGRGFQRKDSEDDLTDHPRRSAPWNQVKLPDELRHKTGRM